MKDKEAARGGDKIEPSVPSPVSAVVDIEKDPDIFYAVARGHLPGIYLTEEACQKQVDTMDAMSGLNAIVRITT